MTDTTTTDITTVTGSIHSDLGGTGENEVDAHGKWGKDGGPPMGRPCSSVHGVCTEAPRAGLEPATIRLTVERSTN